MSDDDIVLPTYEGVMAEIVENFGKEVAIKILRVRGGRRGYIPTTDKLKSEDGGRSWLVDAVGIDVALKISEYFQVYTSDYWHQQGARCGACGTEVDFPVLRDRSRIHKIHKLIKSGMHSADEIAGLVGCSRRTVYRQRKLLADGA